LFVYVELSVEEEFVELLDEEEVVLIGFILLFRLFEFKLFKLLRFVDIGSYLFTGCMFVDWIDG
jgi:hypothetical protein